MASEKTVQSREEARALGDKYYFTGKPCKYGHVDLRRVNDWACLECERRSAAAWRRSNPERSREIARRWNKANPERRRKNRKAHYEANREQQIKSATDWYHANREYARERYKKWQQANPERCRLSNNRRRARKQNSGSHTKEDLDRIWGAQRGKCAGCECCLEEAGHHLDHIFPLAKGGTNDPVNLQFLCPGCNMQKSAKHPIDWARENGRLL